MSAFGGPNIIDDGLVLYLDAANVDSYPGSGTTWTDITRGGNNGTLTNGPTFNTGNGGSIVFDGVNDYVDCGGNVKPTVAISVNTWIYFNSSFGVGNRYLSDWHQNNTQDRWIFYTTGTNQISWYIDTVGQPEGGTTAYTITLNTWVNLCGTYDSTISGGINAQKFYVNGQLYASSNKINSLNTGSITSTIKLGGQVSAGGYLNGRISTTQIYNRALSAQEILQNYNATKSRFGL
jgi:hypothetical protein